MKKRSLLYAGLLMSLAIFTFSSCQKYIDYIEEHGGGGKGKGGADTASNYQITSLAYWYQNQPDTGYFNISYNAAGNPVSALLGGKPGSSNPITGAGYKYYYDSAGRFSYLEYYPEGTYSSINRELVRKFFYSGNLITKDSLYYLEFYTPGAPDPGDTSGRTATYYSYDTQGRMTQAIEDYGNGTFGTINYAYDTSGNAPNQPHDNKVNFHSTNKIWQFLDRDYNRNNPTGASDGTLPISYTYNSAGLPTTVLGNGHEIVFLYAWDNPTGLAGEWDNVIFTYTKK